MRTRALIAVFVLVAASAVSRADVRAGEDSVVTYKLKYAPADTVANEVEKHYQTGKVSSVCVFPLRDSGRVLVIAPTDMHPGIRQFIERLDAAYGPTSP